MRKTPIFSTDMSKRKRSDDHRAGADAESTNFEAILSQLESVRSQAAELDRSLQSQVAEDSSFVSWRSYADRLRLDVPDANKSRALSQQLNNSLAALLKTLHPAASTKVHSHLLQCFFRTGRS